MPGNPAPIEQQLNKHLLRVLDQLSSCEREAAMRTLLLGTLFPQLLDRYDSMMIGRLTDAEYGTVTYYFSGWRNVPDQLKQRISCSRESVLELVQAALDQEPVRRCAQCGQVKPLIQFRRRPNRPGGRDYWCLECNRKKSREHDAQYRRRHGRRRQR